MTTLPQFRDYPAVRDWLYAQRLRSRPLSYRLGIERMERVAELLGNPHLDYPVIHVAGTNGKGSTSAMIEAALRASGKKVGLYTSPHLVHQAERIQIDRRPIAEEAIVSLTNEILARAGDAVWESPMQPSFFEFMTALAFLHFARSGVDAAVIEVGLGGLLDATNIVLPQVSVVTSIGFDHVEILGDTLAAIAEQKAGIIKPGRPVVIGRLPAEAESVMRATCSARGCRLLSVREVFGEDIASYPATALEGDYQRWNAATATLACREFGVPEEAIQAGLHAVSWAGRWQRLRLEDGTELVLDASHNPEGACVLDANLARYVAERGARPVVIVGVLGEFRARALLPVVARFAHAIHLVQPPSERATPFEVLESFLPEEARARAHRSEVAALFPEPGRCTVVEPGHSVVVTGSIYLLGEVLQRLRQPALNGQESLQDW